MSHQWRNKDGIFIYLFVVVVVVVVEFFVFVFYFVVVVWSRCARVRGLECGTISIVWFRGT